MSASSTHQVDQVQGEDVDTASHGGQSADDGGEDAEAARAEQKVLRRKTIQEGGGIVNVTAVNGANESQFNATAVQVQCQKRIYNAYNIQYTLPCKIHLGHLFPPNVISITFVSKSMLYFCCLLWKPVLCDVTEATDTSLVPLSG